jgi:hypothetical protein
VEIVGSNPIGVANSDNSFGTAEVGRPFLQGVFRSWYFISDLRKYRFSVCVLHPI